MRQRQWLLIKHRDEAASTLDITTNESLSTASGRTLADIAQRAGASDRQLKQAEEADRGATPTRAR
jgi:AraC-like DNA-binding protein